MFLNFAPAPTLSLPQAAQVVLTSAFSSNLDDYVAYELLIFGIGDWVTDGGAALEKQEDGCGTVTFWTWTDATADAGASADFNIDFFIKSGCIERAIVSAGGPKISCQGQGLDDVKKRQELRERAAALSASSSSSGRRSSLVKHKPLTVEQRAYLADLYNVTEGATHPAYVPMVWN